jgi:hypothetical protein
LVVVLLTTTPIFAVETFKVSDYGGAHQIWFEVEDFDRRDPADDSSFAVIAESGAYGLAIGSLSADNGTSMIRWSFDISKAGGAGGTWYFWGRVINPNNNSDFMLVDGHPGDQVPFTLPVSGLADSQRVFEQSGLGTDWVWAPTTGGNPGEDAHTKTLKDGKNTMYVLPRESGATWDVFMWTDDPNYVPTDTEYENATATTLGRASRPNPTSGAIDVPRDEILTWTAGAIAVNHDVYFGTSFDDVTTASVANPLGVLVSQGQDANSYNPEGMLTVGQTYYWRVDEANGAPDWTVIPGEVWSLEAEPFSYPIEDIIATASGSNDPNMGPEKTVDGSGLNVMDQHSITGTDMWHSSAGGQARIQYEFSRIYKLHEMWVWNSNQVIEPFVGLGAKDVTIETSQDGAVWTGLEDVPEFAQAPGRTTYTANTVVDFGGAMAKFVRLTINAGWGMLPQSGLSEVRFFYIPTNAREPQPASGATLDDAGIVLKWRAGREAVIHDVSLGTDSIAVADGMAVVDTTDEASFDTGALDYGTTYFWKVDEVNQAETPMTYAGDVWHFTTPDFSTVDSFDQYDGECNRIYFAWIDGLGHSGGKDIEDCVVAPSYGNAGGAIVGNAEAPFAETTIVNTGSTQSMPIIYDSSFGPAETTLTFNGQDWNASSVQTLSLAFSGTEGNTGTLYIKINNTRVMYDLDPTDIARPGWQIWNIDLSGLSGLQNVTSLTIGVDGVNVTGMLYIDDVRLYALPGELITR